jgi:hypothetical protein
MTLARIGRLVASRNRPPLVRTADRLSKIFLPVILERAVARHFLTGEAIRAAAVLLVACSCRSHAASAAFAAAIRPGSKACWQKGGDTLEALSSVTAAARQGRHADRGPALGHNDRSGGGLRRGRTAATRGVGGQLGTRLWALSPKPRDAARFALDRNLCVAAGLGTGPCKGRGARRQRRLPAPVAPDRRPT